MVSRMQWFATLEVLLNCCIFIFSSARSQLYQTLTCQTSRKLKQQSDNQNGCSKAHHLDRYLNVVDFTIFKEQLQRKKPSLGWGFTTMHRRSIPARGSIHFICNKRPYPPNIFFCSAQLYISADWWPYHVPLKACYHGNHSRLQAKGDSVVLNDLSLSENNISRLQTGDRPI